MVASFTCRVNTTNHGGVSDKYSSAKTWDVMYAHPETGTLVHFEYTNTRPDWSVKLELESRGVNFDDAIVELITR